MKKLIIAIASAISLFAFAEEVEEVLVSHAHGLVILNSTSQVRPYGLSHVYGVKLHFDLPGDVKKLTEKLERLFLHKDLTQKDINNIRKTIIHHYQEEEKPVVTVYIPEQEITHGVLQIVVIESTLGKIEAKGANWFSNEKIARQVRICPGEIIDEKILNEDLSWVNRNPFRKTDAIYTPGEKARTTDIELITKDRFPFRLYAGIDNTGIPTIDRNRFFTGFNWANVFGWDHTLSYQFISALDFHKFLGQTANYMIPLPWRHIFSVFGAYSRIHTKNRSMENSLPASSYLQNNSLTSIEHFRENAMNHGTSLQISSRYLLPLSAYIVQDLSFGFDFKRTNNTVEYSEIPQFGKTVNLTQLLLEYTLGYEHHNLKTSIDVEVYYSPVEWLPDQSKSDYGILRPGANPMYAYARGAVLQVLRIPQEFTFVGSFKGQLSSGPLLPSEQFGLGGYSTIRGYDERSFNADQAGLVNLELRSPSYPFFTSYQDGFQVLVFTDFGLGYNTHTSVAEHRFAYLWSFGPGARYQINPYLSFRLDWGIKLHPLGEDKAWNRVHFSLILNN